MLDEIKKYKWRILTLVNIWSIYKILTIRSETRCNSISGYEDISLWDFLFNRIYLYCHIGENMIQPILILLIFVFLLGIFTVKAWNEFVKEALENE